MTKSTEVSHQYTATVKAPAKDVLRYMDDLLENPSAELSLKASRLVVVSVVDASDSQGEPSLPQIVGTLFDSNDWPLPQTTRLKGLGYILGDTGTSVFECRKAINYRGTKQTQLAGTAAKLQLSGGSLVCDLQSTTGIPNLPLESSAQFHQLFNGKPQLVPDLCPNSANLPSTLVKAVGEHVFKGTIILAILPISNQE